MNQGRQRSDSRLAQHRAASGSGNALHKGKMGINTAEWRSPNPYNHPVMLFLHPHPRMSLDSMCGLVFVAQASPSTRATGPFFFVQFTSHQTDANLHSASLTLDMKDHVPIQFPIQMEFFQQNFYGICYDRTANSQSCLIMDC